MIFHITLFFKKKQLSLGVFQQKVVRWGWLKDQIVRFFFGKRFRFFQSASVNATIGNGCSFVINSAIAW